MTKKIFSSLVLMTFCLNTTIAFAEPPKTDDAVIAPIKQSQPAPFEGVLFSIKAASQIAAQLEALPDQIKIERDNAINIERAQCDKKLADAETASKAGKKILQSSLDEKERRLRTLEKALADAEKRAKKPDAYLIGSLGVAGGIALTLGTIFLVGQATK